MINSICILGGGTSGLVTALILKKWYPTVDVKIIESSNVSIVGVGEGSTEHWAQFMDAVDIPLKELITETSATFKTGIKFDNWNGDNKHYFHALHASYTKQIPNGLSALMISMMIDNEDHLTTSSVMESKHHFPLSDTVFQYHFDTFKLNNYLHKKCNERKINFVDDEIVDVTLDGKGFVESLTGQTHLKYHADLFIDSSGFARVISSKLGSKWVDCSEYLPMNKAFAFPTDGDDDIPSHTLSKALSSGWLWRIPTQERYGNGYVYCDEFITDDQALAEAQQLYDQPIEVGRSFKFKAGYVNKFWIKNCISVGLSGSFVEPLEASSIGTSIQQAFAIGGLLVHWHRDNNKLVDQFNKDFENVAKNIIDFVQLHYITSRQDSNFWKHCKNLRLTDFNNEMIPYFKDHLPSRIFFRNPFLLFSELNWMQVMYGLDLFNIDQIHKLWRVQDPGLVEECKKEISAVKHFCQSTYALSHREALNYIMSDKFIQ